MESALVICSIKEKGLWNVSEKLRKVKLIIYPIRDHLLQGRRPHGNWMDLISVNKGPKGFDTILFLETRTSQKTECSSSGHLWVTSFFHVSCYEKRTHNIWVDVMNTDSCNIHYVSSDNEPIKYKMQ